MLLPQSSAFAALKNRLNSVSAIGLLHTPASIPSSLDRGVGGRSTVAAGMPSTSSLPTQTLGAGSAVGVPGRLNRSSREVGSTSSSGGGVGGAGAQGDVRWPELLEKFRQTQEKARRRNERLLRGQSADGPEDFGAGGGIEVGGAARRSLLELHVDTQHHHGTGAGHGLGHGHGHGQLGRAGSRLNDRGPVSAGLRGNPRPGSGLGKPLPLRPDSAQSGQYRHSLDMSRPGLSELGGFVGGRVGTSGGVSGTINYTGPGGTGAVGTSGPGPATLGNEKGHKSRNSLAGNLGKFASGIGRVSSKDRDRERRDKEREGKR
jgi:hypothetical protein